MAEQPFKYKAPLVSLAILALMVTATVVTVQRYHKDGQLDVITAQAMDMSQMRPPEGTASVQWVNARFANLSPTESFPAAITSRNRRLVASAAISPFDLEHIRVGTEAWVVPPSGAGVAAKISTVNPNTGSLDRSPEVDVEFTDAEQRFQVGEYVTLKVARDLEGGHILVPTVSILTYGNFETIWIATAQHKEATNSGGSAEYECPHCHMRYTAAEAARLDYECSMKDGKLQRVAPIAGSQDSGMVETGALHAHSVIVTSGATDGDWSELIAGDVKSGDHVLTNGFAGLQEGSEVFPSPWSQRGPRDIQAVSVNGLYRCQKCGMVISEADAIRNHFIDPMDGGRVVLDQ